MDFFKQAFLPENAVVYALITSLVLLIVVLPMAHQLRKSRIRTQELNRELEYRVKERTAELERVNAELLTIQEKLLEADKLASVQKLYSVGKLTTGLAHEAKNLLSGATGYIQLIMEKMPEDDGLRKSLKTVDDAVVHTRDLLQTLLGFARPSGYRHRIISISGIVDDVLTLMGHQLNLQKIRVNNNVNDDLPMIQADGEHIRQVFLNLSLNAAEAMPKGGTFTITAENIPVEKTVEIQFSDTGEGIQPEDMPHLFDPFFTTKERGTGLGLSVTKKLIESHHGKIAVESTPGKGTTFTIKLPQTQLNPGTRS